MSTAKLKIARKASPALLQSKIDVVDASISSNPSGAAGPPVLNKVQVYSLKTLPTSLRTWAFDLFERNMKGLYEASRDGYDAKEKRAELFDSESRFVVLGSPPVAYAVFRFDTEQTANGDDAEVVYCYEVQVESTATGAGAGRALMRVLAHLGRAFSLQKVMLTVFKANTDAVAFYRRLGYTPDEICPSMCDEPDADYWIMSKLC